MESTQPQPTFLSCPSCSGRGRLGLKPCLSCQSRGLYLRSKGEFLYWDKKYSKKDLWQNRLQKIIASVFIFVLIVFVAFGFYSLFTFFQAMLSAGIFWSGLASFKDSQLLFFWLAVWVILYFYYRLSRADLKKRIPARPPEAAVSLEKTLPSANDAPLQFSKKLYRDISKTFSLEASAVILKSWQVAKKLGHPEVTPLHLLAAALVFKKTAAIFGRLGLPLRELENKISQAFLVFLKDKRGFLEPELSLDLKKTLLSAYALAANKRKTQVDLFDLLIAINVSDSPAGEVFFALDVEKDELQNVILWVETVHQFEKSRQEFGFLSFFKPRSGMNRAMTAIATPILNRFASDLTLLARKGYLEPCVARDAELERILSLAAARKPGVLLVGNPGTGKNTIISGLAQLMVAEQVPDSLKDKRLVNLSLAAIVSGAAASGSAEQRISAVLSEITRSGNIALCLTDLHNMIGVRTTAGELDLTEILSSVASRGRFFLLATTTPSDYKRYLEGAAIDQVLEKININEPEGNQAIQILEVASLPLEVKHQVFFSYDAIASAVALSSRYVHDRYLPEKGLTVLEDSAIAVHKERGKYSIIQKQDIARVVSDKTKIPLTQITEAESQKLLHLEEKIHEKMVDQEPAVKAIANALRRARAQLRDAGRPIANFLFLGPTGVGKTQLAKVVAEIYFGSAKNMIRLDMSEYQEESNVQRLIGSQQNPSGYLTEAVRQNPFALILLDELEKAHPEILNLFLQVMDDGRLTDGLGRAIDFTNAIIIATSNVGAQYIYDAIRQNQPYEKIKNGLIENQLKSAYRPEFLNRFDEIIVFKPLTQNDINQIAILLLGEVVQQMAAKGIKLEFTEPALYELAAAGFDPEFGARPLRRVIQEKVTNALAAYLIQGEIERRDTVIYDVGGKITVKKAKRL